MLEISQQKSTEMTPELIQQVLAASADIGLLKGHSLSMPSTAISVAKTESGHYEIKIDTNHGKVPKHTATATGQSDELYIIQFDSLGKLAEVIYSKKDGRTGFVDLIEHNSERYCCTVNGHGGEHHQVREHRTSYNEMSRFWATTVDGALNTLLEDPRVQQKMAEVLPSEQKLQQTFDFWKAPEDLQTLNIPFLSRGELAQTDLAVNQPLDCNRLPQIQTDPQNLISWEFPCPPSDSPQRT